MPAREAQLTAQLLQENSQFSELYHEHRRLDDQIAQLVHGPYRSEDQQVQETTLKRRRLILKDKMQRILSSYPH